MWFVIGLVPFLGATVLGHWNERELSMATMILIFSGHALARLLMRNTPRPQLEARDLLQHVAAASVVGVATGASVALREYLAAPDLVMMYLIGIGTIAVRWGRGPAISGSALSVLAYNFFFVPPYYSFAVHDHRHLLTFAMMFGVGLLLSTLTQRLRAQALETREATLRAQTEELRSSLLSTVSHDLRTPLAAITGAATALRDEGESQSASGRAELLDTVCEEAERLERLVHNLLDMTQLQAGTLQLRREWVPLEEIVGAALTRLEPQLTERPIRAVVPADLPLVSVDPVLLEQVLINLLENASKYTPTNSPIEIEARVSDDDVIMTVSDQGPGIPEGDEIRIFEKFFRGRHGNTQGAGLGLAICRGIAEAHGGSIVAERRPEGGTTFRVRFPRGGQAPEVPREQQAESRSM
jgi:two-component system sensor histidine kinase KdpD